MNISQMQQAEMQRSQTQRAESRPKSRRVGFHDFELDLATGDLSRDGRPVRLAAQPASALVLSLGGAIARAGPRTVARGIAHATG